MLPDLISSTVLLKRPPQIKSGNIRTMFPELCGRVPGTLNEAKPFQHRLLPGRKPSAAWSTLASEVIPQPRPPSLAPPLPGRSPARSLFRGQVSPSSRGRRLAPPGSARLCLVCVDRAGLAAPGFGWTFALRLRPPSELPPPPPFPPPPPSSPRPPAAPKIQGPQVPLTNRRTN